MLNWSLRVQLWGVPTGDIPTRIKANVTNVYTNLKNIVKIAASNMPGWKVLDRWEASISTDDGDKQIRHNLTYLLDSSAWIEFIDTHSSAKEPVTIDEWKQFAKFVELEINNIIKAKCCILLTCEIDISN